MRATSRIASGLARLGDKVLGRSEGTANRVAGKIGSALVIRATTSALTYGTIVLLANWMEAPEFGRMAFGLSLAIAASLFAGLGQPILALRFIGEYAGMGRPALTRDFLRFSSRRISVGATLACLVPIAAYLSLERGGSAGLGRYLLSAAPLATFLTLAEFQSRVIRGFGLVGWALAPKDVIWRPLALAILAVVSSSSPSATMVLGTLAAVLGGLLFAQYVFVLRPLLVSEYSTRSVEARRSDESTPCTGLRTAREHWRKATGPLWMATFLGQSLQHISVVALGVTLAPADTGAFFGALKTAAMLTLPLQAVNLVIAPMIAREYASVGKSAVQRLANISVLISGTVALIGFTLVVLFGESVLRFMDGEYVNAYLALIIMSAGSLTSALCGSSGYLLTMTGHERVYLRILLVTNLAAVLVIIVLSTILGMTGAALGVALGTSAWNVSVSVWARRHIGIDPSIVGLVAQPRRVEQAASDSTAPIIK